MLEISSRCPTCRQKIKVQHGLRSTYNKGCRCAECIACNSKYEREWRARRRRELTLLRENFDVEDTDEL